MRVVLVRHAIAEDREAFASSGAVDFDRPLTDKGTKRARRGAKGLRRILDERVDLIATSPLVRARETAAVIAGVFSKSIRPRIEEVEGLCPGQPSRATVDWLKQQGSDETVLLVGHEPDLSLLLSYLSTGGKTGFVRFGKAGAALLECAGTPGPRCAELVWLLSPAILRRLGV